MYKLAQLADLHSCFSVRHREGRAVEPLNSKYRGVDKFIIIYKLDLVEF